MNIQRLGSPEDVAGVAAEFVAGQMLAAIEERGHFTLALSGGSTPWGMLNRLAVLDLPWKKAHIIQVDERVAPDGDPDRNLTHIREQFTNRIDLPEQSIYPMPVSGQDFDANAARYSATLKTVAGEPAVLDLVHLGLGSDGHTASLLPGDSLLEETHRDVAMTPTYRGRQRMTLTLPLINRARNILWLITGEDKAQILERLLAGDPEIPAGLVNSAQATIVTSTSELV